MGRLARSLRAAPGSRLPLSGLPWPRRAAALSAIAVVSLGALGLGQSAAFRARPGASYAGPAAAVRLTAAHGVARPVPITGAQAAAAARQAVSQSSVAGDFGRIILPDLLIVAPRGLTRREVARLGKISGVRNLITFDGAQIGAGRQSVSVIGVNPATFRSWVPVRTAADQSFWTELGRGEFVAADSARQRLSLKPGSSYRLAGSVSAVVKFGSASRLGLDGVDLLVNRALSAKLGLVHQVAALISAPGAGLSRLTSAVRAILGPSARMESLRSQQLPVTSTTGTGQPTTYLELFKASAARYCPGLSWTVLAAIGQIESADGTNEGPSSAGALGPMQFEPSTWARWGTDGFGQTGPPDIMNPYDAVPSAARLLCADGAARGGQSLYHAIFDYNHADWYVREVLGLAAEYAAEYR
jgi:Transglycosylase SLT domain